jgi:hypothetical protein
MVNSRHNYVTVINCEILKGLNLRKFQDVQYTYSTICTWTYSSALHIFAKGAKKPGSGILAEGKTRRWEAIPVRNAEQISAIGDGSQEWISVSLGQGNTLRAKHLVLVKNNPDVQLWGTTRYRNLSSRTDNTKTVHTGTSL